MNVEMLKGHLDAIILTTIQSGTSHGYAIIQDIKKRSLGVFDLAEGTVYPALHRLENAGLVTSKWINLPNGRKRRVYEISEAGTAALTKKRSDWRVFTRTVELFLSESG